MFQSKKRDEQMDIELLEKKEMQKAGQEEFIYA
jgi:hypothetical protein